MQTKTQLVDVVALSNERCSEPIKVKLKYAAEKNFTGQPITGYNSNAADFTLMTPKAAEALCNVQNHLIEQGYGLLVYDAYRPKKAVNHFVMWSKEAPASDYELARKAKHYPNIEKSQLFELGYVAEDSGHCYGNTVDLVLINRETGKKLPMGARYDFMDERSHTTVDSATIGEEPYDNRQILSKAMQRFGFLPLEEEFWHFSHGGQEGRETQEPLDVDITPEMKGMR